MVFLSFMWANLGNKCSHIISVHHFEKVIFFHSWYPFKKHTIHSHSPHSFSPTAGLLGWLLAQAQKCLLLLTSPSTAFFFFLVTNNGTLKNSTALGKRFQKVHWDQELGKASACWIPSRILKPHPMGFEDSWNPIFSAICMTLIFLSLPTYCSIHTETSDTLPLSECFIQIRYFSMPSLSVIMCSSSYLIHKYTWY